jgi:hypothetical protein
MRLPQINKFSRGLTTPAMRVGLELNAAPLPRAVTLLINRHDENLDNRFVRGLDKGYAVKVLWHH